MGKAGGSCALSTTSVLLGCVAEVVTVLLAENRP